MIDHRDAQLLLGPLERLRIAALAGEKERPQGLRRPVLLDEFSFGVLAPYGAERRRRREERLHSMLRNDAPEAPASGVPTGLPSYRMVVFPFSSGA